MKITQGYITDKINGIKVNTSHQCHTSNYTALASRDIKYIVVHYTGNSKDIAVNNAIYFSSANRKASAHLFVDNENIYQSIKLNDSAWHCETEGTYYHSSCRNNNSIGIEMCCTDGNYKISTTTKKNTAYLVAYLCNMLGITTDKIDTYVLRHYDITHKLCPRQMAGESNAEWTAFKKLVKKYLKAYTELDKTGFKIGSKTNGVLAVKQLLIIAKEQGIISKGVDNNCSFGSGTEKAVNQVLSKLGYKQNGIAGKKFIKKLGNLILERT